MSNMSVLSFFSSCNSVESQNTRYAGEIIALNEKLGEFGLAVSEPDAREMLAARSKSLKENGRFENGAGTVIRLLTQFAPSRFISSGNLAEVICELLDIFYYIKSETDDKISDEKLSTLLYDCFENSCGGSLELLGGRELERIIRNVSGHGKTCTDDTDGGYSKEPEGYNGLYDDEPEEYDGYEDGTND